MAQYIGINFGTTNTSVVCILADEYGRKEPKYLGEDGKYPFSSIVAIPKNSDEPLLFGRKVRDRRHELSQTHDVYTSMKSYLGKPDRFGGNRYSAKDIVTVFFRHIKDYIKKTWEIDIISASFSYPVDFTPEARRDLFDAAKDAGIEITMLVNESTAACVSFLEECRNFSKVMVLDWGGGTFDISILNLSGTNIFELAVWGDHIGGDDIDRELAERTHSQIAANSKIDGGRFEDMKHSERDDMLQNCETAKIEISNDYGDNYPLSLHSYGAYGRQRVKIFIEQLDDIVKLAVKKRVLTAIDKALGIAELFPSSINGIIIVGGSSNLTAYIHAIRNHFKNASIIYDANKTQWATATGVALMQIGDANLRLSEDVCVRMSNDDTFPIMKKGHPIGLESEPVSFALVEESLYARFIFTDTTGKNEYKMKTVPTKGLLNEGIILKASIDTNQIARVSFSNTYFKENYAVAEIDKLNFHYDISSLVETKTEVKI